MNFNTNIEICWAFWKIRFEFKSAYQGEIDYIVHDYEKHEEYRIHYRIALNDYLERYFNGTPKQYQKEVVGALYIAHRTCEKLSKRVFDAFKEHLQNEWNKYIEHSKKRLERFPEYSDIYKDGWVRQN